MFRHGLHSGYSRSVAIHWLVLTFLGGMVNAGGFVACQRFVSHITGFATLAGVELAQNDWVESLAALSVPIFFIIGATVAGWLTEHHRHVGKKPEYATVMALVGICLTVTAVAGALGFFGGFGDDFEAKHDLVLVALLCMASGLQNGAISSSSAGSVRTTHMTGLATDIGLGVVSIWAVRRYEQRRKELLGRNLQRLATLAAFICGSGVGAAAFLRWQYLAFLGPAVLAFYAMIRAITAREPSTQSSGGGAGMI